MSGVKVTCGQWSPYWTAQVQELWVSMWNSTGQLCYKYIRCVMINLRARVSALGGEPWLSPLKLCAIKSATVFPAVIYGCESWTIKKAEHRRIDAFALWCWRKLLSPLDCKEIQPVQPKGNQSWIFIGRTDVEAETPILWPPDVKNWLTGKDPDAGKDWRQEQKGKTEDEMAGWHHRLDGHEFE